MSESGTPELSKVIGLILENPKLIEEISKLTKSIGESEKGTEETAKEPEKTAQEVVDVTASVQADIEPQINQRRSKRGELLGALKPYLSGQRAKAIDSMMTIADILEVMRAR